MSESTGAERVRMMREGLINCIAPLFSALISMWTISLMLKGLGVEAYGLLLAATALAGTVGAFDIGLEWSITRAVAAAPRDHMTRPEMPFVAAAGTVNLLLGFVGGAAIALAGPLLSSVLRLSDEHRHSAPIVFAFVGLSFLGDRLLAYSSAVLSGLRRFPAVNLLALLSASLRGVGIALLMWFGASVSAVATLQAGASLLCALAGIYAIARYAPALVLRPGRIGPSLGIVLAASGPTIAVALALSSMYWQVTQLTLAVVGGAAWIAPYYVAQRFPLIIELFVGRLASVLMPAAAEHAHPQNAARLAEVLDVGTRWIMVFVLPLAIVTWVLAPDLLRVWVGSADAKVVVILRVSLLSVMVNAVYTGSLEVLWGVGRERTVLVAYMIGICLSGFTGYVLLRAMGIVGASWGMLIGCVGSCVVVLHAATGVCRVRFLALIIPTFRGLLLPALACAVSAIAVSRALAGAGWLLIAAASLTGGLAYALTLLLTGSRNEERDLVRATFGMVRTLLLPARP